eukprot:7255396-Karenia_brevis.AAC.1
MMMIMMMMDCANPVSLIACLPMPRRSSRPRPTQRATRDWSGCIQDDNDDDEDDDDGLRQSSVIDCFSTNAASLVASARARRDATSDAGL